MDQGCINLRWASALLSGLIAGGVRTLVLSPGSRSTPLVLAAQRAPGLALVPILDERSAGFFALGAARACGRPVALLATSGSAPAHWTPAVIEASEAGVPLVLLSADRPPTLRGFGANQTIDQTRLFGAFAREAHDPGLPCADAAALKAVAGLGLRCAEQAAGPRPGPVQVNLPFAEPLVPGPDCDAAAPAQSANEPGRLRQGWRQQAVPMTAPAAALAPMQLPAGRGLVVAGSGLFEAGFAPALAAAAERLALPVLADPLSGLRFGPASAGVLTHYDALLRNPQAARVLRPDWVLHFGGAPVSKVLGEWLAGIPTLLVDPAGGWRDPSHDVYQRLVAAPAAVCAALVPAAEPDLAWAARWAQADACVADLADAHLAASPWCEAHLVRALLQRIPDAEALLCGNSLPIRQLDTWSGTRPSALTLHGNRGASGIDGQLSTLAGLSQGAHGSAVPPCWGLLGDLSAVHDLSGWLLREQLRRPVIVVNNGGGRIFDYLPQYGLPGFEALWRTPVAPPLAALAQAFGFDHRPVQDGVSLEAALEQALGGDSAAAPLLEVRIDADLSRAMHRAFWARVSAAPGLARA
jgi:2-succinyl-5-enolpyruvyl-6-hydroxy-3-cyclohexene-1-carboxylate synthase